MVFLLRKENTAERGRRVIFIKRVGRIRNIFTTFAVRDKGGMRSGTTRTARPADCIFRFPAALHRNRAGCASCRFYRGDPKEKRIPTNHQKNKSYGYKTF